MGELGKLYSEDQKIVRSQKGEGSNSSGRATQKQGDNVKSVNVTPSTVGERQ